MYFIFIFLKDTGDKCHVQSICNWFQHNWNKLVMLLIKNKNYKYFVKPTYLLICSMFCTIVMTVDPIWTLSVCSKCKKWSLCSTEERKRKIKTKILWWHNWDLLVLSNQIKVWLFLLNSLPVRTLTIKKIFEIGNFNNHKWLHFLILTQGHAHWF